MCLGGRDGEGEYGVGAVAWELLRRGGGGASYRDSHHGEGACVV